MSKISTPKGYTLLEQDEFVAEQRADILAQQALYADVQQKAQLAKAAAPTARTPLMDRNFKTEEPSPLRDIVPLRDQLEDESDEAYYTYMNRDLLQEAQGTYAGDSRDPATMGGNVFNPNTPKMNEAIEEDRTPIAEMLMDPDPEGNFSTEQRDEANTSFIANIPDYSFEQTSKKEEGRALDVMRKAAKKVVKMFDGTFGGEMTGGGSIEAKQRINNFLKASPETNAQHVEEVLFKLMKAAEIARGEGPIELGGVMAMAFMHDLNRRQKTASTDILKLKGMPSDGPEVDGLSVQQRRGVKAVESNAAYSGWDSDNNVAVEGSTVGRLVFQAANQQSDGNENALVGEMATAIVPRALQEEYFATRKVLRPDGSYEPVIILNDQGMKFVDKNRSLFNYVLRIPDKSPRFGKDQLKVGLVTKADLRLKGQLKEKSFVDADAERKWAKSIQIADNTGFTIQGTSYELLGLLGGVNAGLMSAAPNSVSHLLDGKKFKKIKLGGELNNRTRSYKITHLDGTEEEVLNHSDDWKDEIFKRDFIQAKGTQGNVFYYNHFLGGNWRLYVDSVTLNYQANHHVRANLGHQTQIPFRLNDKKHMTFLKSGIMRKSGLGPSDTILKYEHMSVQEGAKAFDAIITRWSNKYGELVRRVAGFSLLDAKQQTAIRMKLKDPSSELSLAAKDLLEYAGGTGKYDKTSSNFSKEDAVNGYYGMNAIVEAIKLKDSIDDPNKKIYATNFLYEADGVANGLAINSMFSGANTIAKKTGLSEGMVAGYLHENNLMSERDLYLTLNDDVFDFLYENDTNLPDGQSLKELADILFDSGLLANRDLPKKPLMITSYSAGRDLVIQKINIAIRKRLGDDPALAAKLEKAGWGDTEEMVEQLGNAYWESIDALLAEVGQYAAVQQKFVTELLRQRESNPNLPDPHVLMEEGNRIHTGVMTPTVTGPEMYVRGKPVRQITNKLNPEGQGINKETGEFTGYSKAPVAWNPVITHSMDQLIRRNVDLRSNLEWEKLFSKYKTKGGTYYVDPNGGFMGQVFDGYLGSPMFMEEMDMLLNEEFIKLGDRKSNLTSMIDTARDLGYDMGTPGANRMYELVDKMRTLQREGRAMMRENIRNGGNFPILNGVKSRVISKGAEYKRIFTYEPSIAEGIELSVGERYAIPEATPKVWSDSAFNKSNKVEGPRQSASGVNAEEIFGDTKFSEGQRVYSESANKIGTVTRLPSDARFAKSRSETPTYGVTMDFSLENKEAREAGEVVGEKWNSDDLQEYITEESDLKVVGKNDYVLGNTVMK